MNKLTNLISEIKESMKTNGYKIRDCRPSNYYEGLSWIDRIGTICSEVSSEITIESIKGSDDVRGQISIFKKVENSNTGYTIILNNSAERLNIESIEDLAEIIYDYETLAKLLTLTIK